MASTHSRNVRPAQSLALNENVRPPVAELRPRSFPTITHAVPMLSGKTSKRIRVAEAITFALRDAVILLEMEPWTGAELRVVSVNEPFVRLLGHGRTKMTSVGLRALQGMRTTSRLVEEIRQAARSDARTTLRIVVYNNLTRERNVEADIFPIHDDQGRGGLVGVVLREIPEGIAQDDSMRLSTERFSQAFEYGPIGMALISSDGVWLTVNRRLCDLLGYREEELREINFQSITHPDDLLVELDLAAKTVKGDINFYQIEKRYYHKLGQVVWIHLTASLVRDRDGQPLYFIHQAQDITETRRASEKIAEQAALLDKARDAILVRDLEGKVLFWNQGAERLYGWKSSEVIGRGIADLLYPDPDRFRECNELTIQNGDWHGELEQKTRDHGQITIEARWTLIRDDAGRPKSILAINTDVTEKKKIESQLMRAQRMESIGTLAGGIAHDLNNILTPILMSIEMLKQGSVHPRSQTILEAVEITAKRGADIVRQVLSFARGMKGDHIEVQPRHLFKDIQAFIKDTLPKNIQLKYCLPHESYTILGDPTQLHQIVMNLCVNARDAMPGGGTLTIKTENVVIDEQYASMNLEAKPGKYVVISVADTGTGIPAAILDKIFEPFFTTKEIGKGTGLGLSTVLAIVKSHGGFVDVASDLGKGTTFRVFLPAAEASPCDVHDQAGSPQLPRGNGETILVVDDETSILAVTGETLETFGYRVLTAADGAEAVAIYAENSERVAAVLTDIAMPVMDGISTIRALRRLNPKLRIIAASGLRTNATLQASNPAIQFFLEKPYTAVTLLTCLHRSLCEAEPDCL